jgi:C-terminal processing protease CtpA/Prc
VEGSDGVGIVLEFQVDDLPVVQNMIPGKAAYACGKIAIGDRLTRVGLQSTENKGFSQIRDLIVGPIGSRVTLCFRGMSGEYQCKNLKRGSLDDEELKAMALASDESNAGVSAGTVDTDSPVMIPITIL